MRRDPSFEAAFDSLYPRAWRAAFRIVGERALAEDIAAEALARTYLNWSKVADLPYRDGWVLRVAINIAIGATRRRGTPLLTAEPSQSVEDTVATRLAVLAAVNGLPRRQREVVALRYLADLSEAEVAACLGVATGTIKSHLHRGISTLRVQLGPNFEEAFLATA